MDLVYEFVPYGERFDPQPATIVLDVGMRTVPGVIDHHHPEAAPECAATLIAKPPPPLVDSAPLPKDIELSSTPSSILRALFSGARKEEAEINQERIAQGMRFMSFLYAKSEDGYEIEQNRRLFSGIDRFERAMRNA